ncbi:ABC transporter permease [Paenibacillus taichungensis]|uniref:ABC transporter permease n=1 Tax=Paenibacillus taichungensis TaxID=484184 RepID=UPI002DB963A6|nr:ABC transporter permease [Paenibacillus taichungensis]MEC0106177.1 ABC transporter permease [Paenibacillus taichungensis]MEC0199402.1 ABC transporter permease [Paenibacillus taichungensis]
MKNNVKNFIKYKDLFIELIKKDIKLKYRNSILGIFWSMLNPLLMMVVLTIVFSNLFDKNIENFPVYVMIGRLVYQFFSESTNFAMDSIVTNGQLLKKIYVPKYLFPLSRICSSFFNTLVAIIPVFLVMIVTGVNFHWTNLLVVYPLFCLLLISVGVGLLLSTINVYFRDIKHLYSVILTLIMYLTPIFYPAEIIPDKYMVLIEINPLFNVVSMFRTMLLDGAIPSVVLMFFTFIYAILLSLIGLFVFYKNQHRFVFHL